MRHLIRNHLLKRLLYRFHSQLPILRIHHIKQHTRDSEPLPRRQQRGQLLLHGIGQPLQLLVILLRHHVVINNGLYNGVPAHALLHQFLHDPLDLVQHLVLKLGFLGQKLFQGMIVGLVLHLVLEENEVLAVEADDHLLPALFVLGLRVDVLHDFTGELVHY